MKTKLLSVKVPVVCSVILSLLFAIPLHSLSDLEKCRTETVALKLKYKYCYKDKVRAEQKLQQLRQQYTHEKKNLDSKIKKLTNNINSLSRKIEALKKSQKEEQDRAAKKAKEQANTIAILKKKSSNREQQLIQENNTQRTRFEQELNKIKNLLTDERNRNINEVDLLKDEFEKKNASLRQSIDNLNEELSSLKKLSKNQKDELERLAAQERELEKMLQAEIKKGEIRLKKFHNKLIINIDDKISFDSGSARLKKEIMPALKKITKILANYPENQIMIEGHTDNVPISNRRFEDNWQLSTQRALSVLRYILQNKDLDRERFSAAGYGEYRPIVPNTTSENKALNRRVDIVVIPRITGKK